MDWWRKSRPSGIRSPDRPARSELLYRLHCPSPQGCSMQNLIKVFLADETRGGIFMRLRKVSKSDY